MRLTKGMKKALSMFLTGALVVTGASIPATQTKAASAEKLTWEGTIKAVGIKAESDWEATTTSENFTKSEICGEGNFSTWAGGGVGSWCGANLTATVDLSAFEKPVLRVTCANTTDADIDNGLEVCFKQDSKGNWVDSEKIKVATGAAVTIEKDIPVTKEDADAQFVAVSPAAKKNVVVNKVEVFDAAYTDGGEAPAGKSFHATLQYLDPSWATQEDTVEVTKDGDYTLTTWAGENAESTINMGWIETDLKNGDVSEDFKMTIKSIQLGTKLYTFSKADERYLGFKDQTAVTEDGEMGTYRLNIKNDYNALFDFADHQTKVKGTKANMFLGKDLITDEEYDAGMNAVNKGDVVQVKFTVEGFESEKAAKTYTQIADKDAEVEDTVNAGEYGNVEYTVSTVENIANPDEVREFLSLCKPDTLAIGIGNAHGYYRGTPDIHLEILEAVRKFTDIPLVLHGCTGMADSIVKEAIKLGVAKINFGTEIRYKYVEHYKEALEKLDYQGHSWKLSQYASDALTEDVKKIIELSGSAGTV